MTIDVLKGLRPARKQGSNYNAAGGNMYPIANGYASNIGEGDPVKLDAGVIELATNGEKSIGVFKQVSYIDSEDQLQVKKNFTANTSSKGGKEVFGGYKQPMALITDDKDQTYVIRTSDTKTLAATALGSSFKVSAIGSVVNGISQAVLDVDASAGTSGGHMVTVTGLWTGRDSEWGVSPIAVEVKLSNPGILGEL